MKTAHKFRISEKKSRLSKNLIDSMSFNREIRQLVDALNNEIASPGQGAFRPVSHPGGFTRLITKRQLTIAEAYLRLVSLSRTDDYRGRLEALSLLMHQVWHSKSLSMPLNTARVQIALIKAAIRKHGDRRAQLELMTDFSRASYGQGSVIRRLLREMDLIEVPETGEQLFEMNLGWDDHVHDSMTEGRKSPSHLVLDAFIKGMSRITVSYYEIDDPHVYDEIYEAGKILGVSVRIGIEFSVGKTGERLHYMYVPPQTNDVQDLYNFFEDNAEALKPLLEGLRENGQRRRATVNALLENFNHSGLNKFNEPFDGLPSLQLKPLSWDSIEKVVSRGQASRIHLGQVIHKEMLPVALRRVLYLKNQCRSILSKYDRGDTSSWEVERCFQKYETERKEYELLTPAVVAERYIVSNKQVDYDSVFLTEDDIFHDLRALGGELIFIHPLSQGNERGIHVFFRHYRDLTGVEVFNLVEAVQRDSADMRRFSSLIDDLQHQRIGAACVLLEDWRISIPEETDLEALSMHLREHPIHVHCGSDAVGWSPNVPGMGFIHQSALSKSSLRLYRQKHHARLPRPSVNLIQEKDGIKNEKNSIYLMSSTMNVLKNRVGDEDDAAFISPIRFWRYLNPVVRSTVKNGIGILAGVLCLGWVYAILWFVLTGVRNMVVDEISAVGLDVKRWNYKNLNSENLANSQFFSGLSIPLLLAAKLGFDYLWLEMFALPEGFLFTFIKFWVIAFTNGIYLMTHNTLRGFDKPAIRGNFFRTVLSWPLATAGSFILTPIGVPDVVQSKIWSEVVGGVIEGSVKGLTQIKLARKSILDVYERIRSSDPLVSLIARVDILYFWAKQQKGRKPLRQLLELNEKTQKKMKPEEIANIHKTNAILYDRFTTEGSMESMTYTVLEYYAEESEENIAKLTDFIGESHDPFVRWLGKYCKDRMEGSSLEERIQKQEALHTSGCFERKLQSEGTEEHSDKI